MIYIRFKRSLKTLLKRFLRADSPLRKIFQRNLMFVSFADAATYCDEWIKTLPRDVDVIVGIPRSGLFVANILALKLGKPLTTPENIGTVWQSKHLSAAVEPKKYLLVDDSYRSGASMEDAIGVMLGLGIPRESIITAALIVGGEGQKKLDHFFSLVDGPRFFEWNMLHKKMFLASDLDGVICEDPPVEARDSDTIYEDWLRNAKPYLVPAFEIEYIVTSRLERYRNETENWLRTNGVLYKNLIMSNAQTRQEQRVLGLQHKITLLNNVKPDIYWESSTREGLLIKKHVRVPILVIDQKNILL